MYRPTTQRGTARDPSPPTRCTCSIRIRVGQPLRQSESETQRDLCGPVEYKIGVRHALKHDIQMLIVDPWFRDRDGDLRSRSSTEAAM